jgi:type II secretory pathway predicted ATPase ExeA
MRAFLTHFGLKFNPCQPDIPTEAIYVSPPVDTFVRRVEANIRTGGFAMASGEPGLGKSLLMRIMLQRFSLQRDVLVASIEHPQSSVSDFYRELGDLFGISLKLTNRWGGFKTLRNRWADHITSCHRRPVLLIDDAHQMSDAVLNELRILASKDFDANSLLCVVLCGESRLPERFRHVDLLSLGTRIRRRLVLEPASHDQLIDCLDYVFDKAGNPSLMTRELKAALAEHSMGNPRVMMNTADELLSAAFEQNKSQLDEKLYFEVFAQPQPRRTAPRKR